MESSKPQQSSGEVAEPLRFCGSCGGNLPPPDEIVGDAMSTTDDAGLERDTLTSIRAGIAQSEEGLARLGEVVLEAISSAKSNDPISSKVLIDSISKKHHVRVREVQVAVQALASQRRIVADTIYGYSIPPK